jgi:Tc toxin complex TcA C-terminal TcB-binding domain
MITTNKISGFHDAVLTSHWLPVSTGHWDNKFTYTYENFFHPFVGELLARLNTDSLAAAMDAAWQTGLKQDFFQTFYQMPQDRLVGVVSFPKEIDVDPHGSYSNYNWELFFHIPLTIAVHLSKTRRFAEAQRWFHYIFDPTSSDTAIDPPQRFWKFLAFRNGSTPAGIDHLLALLSKPPAELSPQDQALRADVLNGYRAILDNPFQPHAVARTRIVAYQYAVVMKYLDNLIAWGDDLFQQDTLESLNEATQVYVLAFNLLGPRPQRIPPLGAAQTKTFAQLKAIGLDATGNALVDLESQFPFDLGPGSQSSSNGAGSGPLFGIGRTLYFCVPRNDKMLGYWDTVADRLFKIRHCMNIQGVVRPLALFDPPLDPGMLVRAAAEGIDIGSIVNGLNQPVGPVRCVVLIQKALELCAEVRALGGALLSVLEKGDAEHLALLRQGHEIQIGQMMQEMRFLQLKNAEESTNSLLTSRNTVLERLAYYQRLLGLPVDPNATGLTVNDLIRDDLTEENFDDLLGNLVSKYDVTLTPQNLPELKLAANNSPALLSGVSGHGNLFLNTNEDQELNTLLPHALDWRLGASAANVVASYLAPIPTVIIAGHPVGVGADAQLPGGPSLASAAKYIGDVAQALAMWDQDQAGMAARTAGYERRADEWMLQYNLAALELKQNGRQILTNLIGEQIARHDYITAKQQIENSQQVNQFLNDKFTNEDLFLWMQGETSRLYYDYYRFAFDTARKAERTMKQELMRPELDSQDFVKFNYWSVGRQGLLAGEALHLDVKRMEIAYLDNNKRELELTRHVSLRQLDPVALLTLKSTGSCQVTIPEWLYDKDCPGHYMRRMKSVAMTIPSVTGPYTTVNCTLTLLKSSIRRSPLLTDNDYARQGSDDDRFIDYAGAVQSIVTSSAIGDSGMFETNFRDERFLPFEGAGAISSWKLDLPADYRAFDYATISDVVLHIRYTARQGVDATKVKAALDDLFQTDNQANLALLFNLRNEFPTEWSAFANGSGDFSARIRRDYFPYFTQNRQIAINGFDLYGQDVTKHHVAGDQTVWDGASADLGDSSKKAFTVTFAADAPGPAQVLTRMPDASVFLIIRYSMS